MEIEVPRGKYIVAVSGGVDSMVLLHLLVQQRQRATSNKQQDLDLIVGHFNHGIRPDAELDEALVRNAAREYKLPFETSYGKLGANASEAQARAARYKFLHRISNKYRADNIITAHHRDDLLETAIINLIRGSGRRGLSAISQNPQILRPLLGVPKSRLVAYAKKHHLRWREDPTNQNDIYLRNYVRRQILAKLNAQQRQELLNGLERATEVNRQIDHIIEKISQNIVNNNQLDRLKFIALPEEIGREVLAHFLRGNGISGYNKPTIVRLALAIKTAKPGSSHDVTRHARLIFTAENALLMVGVET